jgi:hypothetical protein
MFGAAMSIGGEKQLKSEKVQKNFKNNKKIFLQHFKSAFLVLKSGGNNFAR